MEILNEVELMEIVKLLSKHQSFNAREIEEMKAKLVKSTNINVLRRDDYVAGVVYPNYWNHDVYGACATLVASVIDDFEDEEWLHDKINSLMSDFKDNEVKMILWMINMDDQRLNAIASNYSFDLWYGYDFMRYQGQRKPTSNLSKRNIVLEDFYPYYTALGECFTPMRQALDIPPYNVFENQSKAQIEHLQEDFIKQASDTYMFYEHDQWVGTGLIREEDIDDLFVVPNQMGKGYGQAILHEMINLVLDQNKTPYIGYVTWNVKAKNLYVKNHFQIYLRVNHYRLFL